MLRNVPLCTVMIHLIKKISTELLVIDKNSHFFLNIFTTYILDIWMVWIQNGFWDDTQDDVCIPSQTDILDIAGSYLPWCEYEHASRTQSTSLKIYMIQFLISGLEVPIFRGGGEEICLVKGGFILTLDELTTEEGEVQHNISLWFCLTFIIVKIK